jgi:hypothetical protein
LSVLFSNGNRALIEAYNLKLVNPEYNSGFVCSRMQHVKSPTKAIIAEVGLWYVWSKKTPLRGFWRLRGHVKTCLVLHAKLNVIKSLGAHAP